MTGTIRIVWGTATGPTAKSAYDAALADANIHNYNLVPVSSVIPANATVEAIGTAPDLGPAGERLTVVQAHATAPGPTTVSAGLGWSVSEDGPGIFYEAGAETDEEDVRNRLAAGLEAGRGLREWTFGNDSFQTQTARADAGTYAGVVVVAVYGRSEPIC